MSIILPQPRVETGESINNKGDKFFYLKVIPEQGPWAIFEINRFGNILVKIDLHEKLPFDLFLSLFQQQQNINCVRGLYKIIYHFLNEKHYKLSDSVRRELNQFLYPEEMSSTHLTSQLLTKKDIIAIGDYLFKKIENK